MFRPIRTYTEAWLNRHRETHAKHAAFGTHQHPYLHPVIRQLAGTVAAAIGESPSLLDYGCGKGIFMQEMDRLALFRYIKGYDPAVDAFKTLPAQSYDMVTCLDVLDQLEPEFVEAAIKDVAQFAAHVAIFDVITVQSPNLAHLNPRSAAEWCQIIGGHMQVKDMIVRPATDGELRQGACPERVIITAAPTLTVV